MKKILHIAHTNISLDSRIRREITAIAQLQGVKINAIGIPEVYVADENEIDGAKYIQLRMQSRRLRILPRAIRYFFEMIEFTVKTILVGAKIQADIIHCHDTFTLPAGWFLRVTTQCKLVYDAHELESNKNAQSFLLSQSTFLIERFCWRKIDLLVSVSHSILNWYKQHLGEKSHLLLLNSPICKSHNKKDGDRRLYFHHLYNFPENQLVFIYLGILDRGRGIEACLNTFAHFINNAHVVFVGFGNLENEIEGFSQQYPNIHLHPPVPHDQVVALVRSADYGLCLIENVSLSDYYSLPNKLFEYAFAGIPVLASDFPEISEIVEKYSLGMCCLPKADSIQQAIEHIVSARPTFPFKDLSELSWTAQAAKLIETYESLLLRPQRSEERILNPATRQPQFIKVKNHEKKRGEW